jgi:hypothetical protein
MKYLIPLLLLTSCASRQVPQLAITPVPTQSAAQPLAAVQPLESVRYGEVVRTYYIGRYIDSSDTLHEQHPVYRAESSAHWNLHPGNSSTALTPPADASYSPAPTNDAVIAELNHQREVTRQVMSESEKLARSFAELQEVINQMKNVAKNNVQIRMRLVAAEEQLGKLAGEIQKLSVPPTIATNEVHTLPE